MRKKISDSLVVDTGYDWPSVITGDGIPGHSLDWFVFDGSWKRRQVL